MEHPMNRRERRMMKAEQTAHIKAMNLPAELTPVSPDAFPTLAGVPAKAWVSRYYLVQFYEEANSIYPALCRLSICRVKRTTQMRWQDGITWDELQQIKHDVGYGSWYALEVYPRDMDLVNVANMRHLWLLPQPLAIGWFGKKD